MKSILITCGVIFAAILAFVVWNSTSEDNHFGKPFSGFIVAPIPDMVANPASYIGKPVSIQGVLKRQCPSTGCWFYLADPADPTVKQLKVEMGDTTPKLPQRIGQTAHVEGQLIKFGDGYEFIGVAVTFKTNPPQ
jgi:hypothetical protein